MSREEAIAELNTFKIGAKSEFGKTALDMAIHALQEPSGDAVSRQWLMRKATEKFYTTNYFNHITKMIEEAPSVKPQEPKTGHWIWQTEDIYQCSECGEDIHVKEVMNEPQYICCPMCGCPMEIER